MHAALALTLLLALAAPAWADETITAFQAHKAAQAKYVDAELNKVYKALLPLLTPEEKKKLIQAEAAWIKYRDLECSFEGELGRGYAGLSDALNADCFIRLTRVRAEELKTQLSTKQPNVSPSP